MLFYFYIFYLESNLYNIKNLKKNLVHNVFFSFLGIQFYLILRVLKLKNEFESGYVLNKLDSYLNDKKQKNKIRIKEIKKLKAVGNVVNFSSKENLNFCVFCVQYT